MGEAILAHHLASMEMQHNQLILMGPVTVFMVPHQVLKIIMLFMLAGT